MKRIVRLLAAVLLCAGPAAAVFNADDPVPAATLLLPYFEVDRLDPNGVRTTFTVRNASPAAALAHVTLWSVDGDPFLFFDLLLTGFDVQEVRLADVIEGDLPANEFCEAAAKAVPVPRGFPPIVTGFATIDSVSQCSSLAPGEDGYFVSGGFGVANNSNVLWGEYQLVQRAEGIAFGERLVSIEALEAAPFLTPRGGSPAPSFYSTFTDSDGADQRERLSARWGGRYDVRPGTRTEIILWRNFLPAVALPAVGLPRGAPFPSVAIVAFDEDGGVAELSTQGVFPSFSNRVRLDSEELPVPFDSGWFFLDASGLGSVIAVEGPSPRGVLLEGQAHMVVLRWRQDQNAATATRGVNLRNQSKPEVD